MAFKMKGFSAFKLFNNKPSEGYGSRPGERSGGRSSERADKVKRRVEERRAKQGGPRIKSIFGSGW